MAAASQAALRNSRAAALRSRRAATFSGSALPTFAQLRCQKELLKRLRRDAPPMKPGGGGGIPGGGICPGGGIGGGGIPARRRVEARSAPRASRKIKRRQTKQTLRRSAGREERSHPAGPGTAAAASPAAAFPRTWAAAAAPAAPSPSRPPSAPLRAPQRTACAASTPPSAPRSAAPPAGAPRACRGAPPSCPAAGQTADALAR